MHLVHKTLHRSSQTNHYQPLLITPKSKNLHEHTQSRAYIHACAARPVDDDRLACLVYIVLHAKVGRHPVDQHTVVRRHVRELLKGTERDGKCVGR